MCPEGTYTNVNGSVQCKPCRQCNAYSSLCSPMRDAVCMVNNTCPPEWDLDLTTNLCTMCARGYLNISNRCIQCHPNFFCASLNTYEVCQDIRMIEREGKFVVVPSSPPGSYHPSSCSCSTAGGFEGSSGLFGCTPCKDGFFSEPGLFFFLFHARPFRMQEAICLQEAMRKNPFTRSPFSSSQRN